MNSPIDGRVHFSFRQDFAALNMIWRRDLIRLSRDKAQITGSLARPLLWLVVLGFGMGSAFSGVGGNSYVEYLFPGIVGLNLLYAAFLSAISIIWDREFGFLKEMVVAPISRTSIALGKVISGSLVACLQGGLVLAFIPFIGVHIGFHRLLLGIPFMFLLAFSITALGLLIASRMTFFEGFGTIANFVIMPMFFLSGALFPLTRVPVWLRFFSRVNPMTYGVDGLRAIFLGVHVRPLEVDAAVLALFAAVMVAGAIWSFSRRI